MTDVEGYSTTAASNTTDFYEGQAPSTLNNAGRETQADIAAAYQRINGSITAGGTADALTVSFTPAHTSLRDGRVIVVRAASDNTSTTPTLNLDSLGAKTVTKNGNEALRAGDIQSGADCIFRYNSANTVWELLNPALPPTEAFAEGQWPTITAGTTYTYGVTGRIDATTTSTSYVNTCAVKDSWQPIIVPRTGTYRFSFYISRSPASGNYYARVYVNGVAAGTEIIDAGTTPTLKTVDIAVNQGDYAELYFKHQTGAATVTVTDFKMQSAVKVM